MPSWSSRRRCSTVRAPAACWREWRTAGFGLRAPLGLAVFDGLAARIGAFAASALLWAPLDERAQRQAELHHLRLTKPPGSLGRLEDVGVQLAGIAGTVPPPLPRPPAVAVFAGDPGVHAQGVSPWPQEVTAQMVANFLSGGATAWSPATWGSPTPRRHRR